MNIIDSLIERGRRHRAYASLRMLDDHLLRDIGITRGEISALERGHNTISIKKLGL
jgi:uncharacterized protein YjiS (DUF1127 family)